MKKTTARILVSITALACAALNVLSQPAEQAANESGEVVMVPMTGLAPIDNLPNLQLKSINGNGYSFSYGEPLIHPTQLPCVSNFVFTEEYQTGGTWYEDDLVGCDITVATNHSGDISFWGPCQVGDSNNGCRGWTNGTIWSYYRNVPYSGDTVIASAILYCNNGPSKPQYVTMKGGATGCTCVAYSVPCEDTNNCVLSLCVTNGTTN